MKIQKYIPGILTAAALLATASVYGQANTPLLIYSSAVNTGGTEGGQAQQYIGSGAPGSGGADLSVPYGNGTIVWDNTETDPANDGGGSMLMTANFSDVSANGGNNFILDSVGFDYDNWYYGGSGTADFSQYNAVQFDVLYNTNSMLNITQFNTGSNWNAAAWFGAPTNAYPDYMATNSYYNGINIDMFTGSGGATAYLGNFQIPAGAASGWQTVTVPYSDTISGLTTVAGLWFQGSFGGQSAILPGTNISASFWVDNVYLLPNGAPPPPPTVSISKPAPGLAVFNATEANSFYDRNQIVANTTSGLSWVGNPGATYSFNIAAFPTNDTYSCEGYLIMVPNSTANANGEDYNQANCMIVEVQSTPTGGQVSLNYKLNQANLENLTNVSFSSYSGPSAAPATPTSVPSGTVVGTYTVTFTGNDSGTVTTPDGTTGTFSLPAGTFDTAFAENSGSAFPFLLYLGGQANSAGAMNQAVVYSSFTATGTPSAASVDENFVADANVPANLPRTMVNWSASTTHYLAGITLVPSSALYWLSWTLPANGYSLVDSASLSSPSWQNVTNYTAITLFSADTQLVASQDLQSPSKDQYFALVQRVLSQLVVLLPGETFTPGVAPGYSGSPTTIANGPAWPDTATVYAVDSGYQLISSDTDSITLECTTDSAGAGDFVLGNNGASYGVVSMTGGIASFTGNNSFSWGNGGLTAPATETVTAIDTSATPNITNSSAPVNLTGN
jgi:hypothetical protein